MANKQQTDNSGKLPPGGYKELWRVAYPLIITNATHTVMLFIDRKFLAMNATDDVAAALPAGILSFTMFTFFMITTGFTAAIVSQNYGRKNYHNCARVTWCGFHFALISGLFCSLALTWVGLFIIKMGQHSPTVMTGELEYFPMIMPSGGFIFISTAFCSFFSGRGKTWTVAIVHFIASSCNIILDYMLIFGKWGAPEMGIAGAGLATTIACVIGAIIAFAYFILQDQKKYPTRQHWGYNHVDMRRLISFGAPSGIQIFFSVSGFTVIVFLIGQIGSIELAATTIALSINMLTFMPLLGISEATSILTGKYIGAKKLDISEKIAYRSWKLSTAYMVCMGIFYLLFPELLLQFFAPKGDGAVEFQEVINIGKIILICAAIYNIFNVLRFVFMGALRGAGDTRVPMWIMILASWLILAPGGYFIINILKLDIVAVWIFLTAYGGLIGVMIWWRFKTGAWKKIDMLDKFKPKGPTEPPLIESLDYEADSPHV